MSDNDKTPIVIKGGVIDMTDPVHAYQVNRALKALIKKRKAEGDDA